ncbi:MAG TPA: hypothetical protein VLJ21_04575 [Candidatus Binatia bacterium]|nr:hypothetical protein [Candidatus Binatia bacterium]
MAKSMSMAGCTCGPGSIVAGIIAAVVLGIGLWSIIGGIQAQWGGASWKSVLVWYAVGFIVLGVGKMIKRKAMSCPVHGMH